MVINQRGTVKPLSVADVLDFLRQELPDRMRRGEPFVIEIHGKGTGLSLHVKTAQVINSLPAMKPLEERR